MLANGMAKPPLPSTEAVQDWLRQNVRKKRPGPVSRLLGESAELSYEVSEPVAVEDGLLQDHVVFTVGGEDGLLPLPCLPMGSAGWFASSADELWLLWPGSSSVEDLLRREGAPLDDAEPVRFGPVLLECAFRNGRNQHVVIRELDHLRHFSAPGIAHEYEWNDTVLRQAEEAFAPPHIECFSTPEASSYRTRRRHRWRLVCMTLHGWMHNLQNLGIETIEVSSDYVLTRGKRQVLSKRVFASMPIVSY